MVTLDVQLSRWARRAVLLVALAGLCAPVISAALNTAGTLR